MLDWIVEGLRWMIWGLTSACLELMDVCYKLITQIATADFLTDPTVWQWYYTFMLFLGVLIVGRSLSVFLKFSFDEEFQEKVNAKHFINKFIGIALIIALLPVCLGFISQVSAWGIRNISMMVGTQSSSEPSTLVISAFMNTSNGEFNQNGEWIQGNKVTYTRDDVDINAEGTGEDDYKFFNDISDLFILALIGITSAIMLVLNGVQIGKRSYSLVMKFIIAPIPISSLIVPGDETFSMWRKMIISDYLLNYVQTLMIMVVMILSGSKILQDTSVWVQIISLISGLLLLLSGIPELAKILGGDTSQGSVLQQIASFRMATRGMGHGALAMAGGAARSIGGGAKLIGAMGAYGMGRAIGGESIAKMKENMKAQGKDPDNGFMGGNKHDGRKDSESFGSQGKEKDGKSYNHYQKNKQDSRAFNESSTKSQQAAGKHLGIKNMDQMSKGEASLALEKAGAEKSYWSDDDPIGSNGRDYSNVNSSKGTESIFGNASSTKATTGARQETGSSTSIDGASSKAKSTREGSKAEKIATAANEQTGIRGASARFATNASSHIYRASAQRLAQTKVYRAGSYAKRLTQGGNSNDIPGSPKL